jgi:hypothetical protein
MTTTAKTPQDRKPKDDGSHRFTVGGKTYRLPAIAEDAAETIPGEITYNAVMQPDNEMAQMRLALASLEAVKPSAAAMAALKSLPTTKMLTIVVEWMGGSTGSSD